MEEGQSSCVSSIEFDGGGWLAGVGRGGFPGCCCDAIFSGKCQKLSESGFLTFRVFCKEGVQKEI